MEVIYINGSFKNYPSYSLEGSILEIEGREYDLLALQEDEQSIINVMENDRFVANIMIPPAKYEEIETDEVDDEDRPVYKKIKKSLDLESVTLNLWKKEIKQNEREEI